MFSGIFVYLILEDSSCYLLLYYVQFREPLKTTFSDGGLLSQECKTFNLFASFLFFFFIIIVRVFSAVLDSLVVYCKFIFVLCARFFLISHLYLRLYLVKLPIVV